MMYTSSIKWWCITILKTALVNHQQPTLLLILFLDGQLQPTHPPHHPPPPSLALLPVVPLLLLLRLLLFLAAAAGGRCQGGQVLLEGAKGRPCLRRLARRRRPLLCMVLTVYFCCLFVRLLPLQVPPPVGAHGERVEARVFGCADQVVAMEVGHTRDGLVRAVAAAVPGS